MLPASYGKGKEKVEGYRLHKDQETNSSNHDSDLPKFPTLTMQPMSLENNMHRGGTIQMHQSMERNLRPEPPDETLRMDEGSVVVVENVRMEGQDTLAGDI